MNVLVVGLGSMGKRRIRLMQVMYPEYVIYGVDGREDRRKEASVQFGMECAASISAIKESFVIDVAFVCTSPLSHNAIIKECLYNGWHVFTELNLVDDGYEENMALAEKMKCKLFLSSTFLYREEISYIRSKVDTDTKWNYVYHIGQYLPDWHPWENYKDFFVGDSRTNGCREIMAIELPWLTKTFGKVMDYHIVSDKMTGLNITYHDNYLLELIHENGNKGVLIVDVVSPVAVRRLEVYGEHKYIQWDGTPEVLMEYDKNTDKLLSVQLKEKGVHKEGYRNFVIENAYKNEIADFFQVIIENRKLQYDFVQDLEILRLIDKFERK